MILQRPLGHAVSSNKVCLWVLGIWRQLKRMRIKISLCQIWKPSWHIARRSGFDLVWTPAVGV